jgi:DNA-binding Xre family transcriptional regulator
MRLRVRELAEARGWDIYRMCSEAKLTLTTMNKVWVAPDVEIPNVESKTLEKLAAALGIEVKDLYA